MEIGNLYLSIRNVLFHFYSLQGVLDSVFQRTNLKILDIHSHMEEIEAITLIFLGRNVFQSRSNKSVIVGTTWK